METKDVLGNCENSLTTQDSHFDESTALDDENLDIINSLKVQALIPLKEDLSAWLNRPTVLGPVGINADNFTDVLDSGVLLCRLAERIRHCVDESRSNTDFKESMNTVTKISRVKFHKMATGGSWLARDNAANFLAFCREFGVKSECLFESEGVVLHREPRNVVLCLLELARLAALYGLEPPSLIVMEKEIDERSMEPDSQSSERRKSRSSSVTSLSPSKSKNSVNFVTKSKPSTSITFNASSTDKLDERVKQITGRCSCQDCFEVSRLSEGKYRIGGKVVFVRVLQDSHVMVRVGGGWDTLLHYLVTHDPCKVKEFERPDGNFLFAKGKYKVK